MTDHDNVPNVTPADGATANPGAPKKAAKKGQPVQIPAELLSQPDVGALIAGVTAWAASLKPPKKPDSFAKFVTRVLVTSAISTPTAGHSSIIGLSRDGSLFDPVEAAVALDAAVNAGMEGACDAIKAMSVLLGSIIIGKPEVSGPKARPMPGVDDKSLMTLMSCRHHTGDTEGCLSREVDEAFGPVAGRLGAWIALAKAELHWASTTKGRGRRHMAGIARGITDVLIRTKDVDASMVLPLVMTIASLDAKEDQTAAVAIMAQRKKLAESPVGQRLRQQMQWLHPKAPESVAPVLPQPSVPSVPSPSTPPAAVAPVEDRTQLRLVEDLRAELASLRSDLSDRDRVAQKLRAEAGELASRLDIVGKERDAVRATRVACEAEIERLRVDAQDGGKALAEEVGRTQRLKAELATLRTTIDDDLRRQERATRALMARRLFEKAGRIGEWLQSVEAGKADIKGLRETWDEFVATLRNEANP